MLISLPDKLEHALLTLAEQQEVSVDQLCVKAFTAYMNAYAPKLLASDEPEKADVAFEVQLTNAVLCEAIDSSADRVVLRIEGEELVLATIEEGTDRELKRCPYQGLAIVRKRLNIMSFGDDSFEVTRSGRTYLIRLISMERNRIVLGIE